MQQPTGHLLVPLHGSNKWDWLCSHGCINGASDFSILFVFPSPNPMPSTRSTYSEMAMDLGR